VARYLIPHVRGSQMRPWMTCPDLLGNSVLAGTYKGLCSGVLKGRSAEVILLGCPLLLQPWCHEQFTIGRPVIPLYAYDIQGLRQSVRHSHERRRQVDAILRGGCSMTWTLTYCTVFSHRTSSEGRS
jgi:hypothetical protein